MPRRSIRKVSFKKRRFSRKSNKKIARNRYRSTRISKYIPNLGLPKTRLVKLRYHASVPFTSTSGVLTQANYSANSAYDPLQSGVGHQPYGYDQWAALYKSYRVVGSKMKATWHNNGTSLTPVRVGVAMDHDTVLHGTLSTRIEEHPSSQSRLITTNDRDKATLVARYSPKKALDSKVTIGDQTAVTTANPATQYFYVIWLQSADSATTSSVTTCDLTIEYLVLFSDLIDQVGS